MLALALLITAYCIGRLITRVFRLSLTRFERGVYAAILGVVAMGYGGLILSYVMGFTRTSQVTLLGIFVVLAIFGFTQHKQPPVQESDLAPKTKWVWWLIVPLALLLLWLAVTVLTVRSGDYWINNSSNYGDIRLHLAYINNFLNGHNIPVESPIFSGTVASYPFLVDFLTAQLIVLGLPMHIAFAVLATIGYSLVASSLAILSLRLIPDKRVASLAPLLLLLNGGLAFFTVFWPEWKQMHYAWPYLLQTPHDYAIYREGGYYFGNTILIFFSTQRSLLIGFPLTLLILTELHKLGKNAPWYHPVLLGLLAGSLAIIHTSSLIIIAVYLIYLAIKQWGDYRNKKHFITAGILFLVPLLLVGGLLAHTFLGQTSSLRQTIQFARGWLGDGGSGDSVLLVWVKSWLIVIATSFVGLWLLYKKHKSAALFTGYAYTIFILANLIIFHPWAWDNTKYFLYWYTFMTLPIAYLIVYLWEHRLKMVSVILVLGLTASGALDLLHRVIPASGWYELVTQDDIRLGQELRNYIPPKSYVLTYSNMLNPLVTTLGRRLVFADEAWLWSHGITGYRERFQATQLIYSGAPQAGELLKKLGVGYVIISDNERQKFPQLNENYFAQNYKLVYKNDQGVLVYKVVK